MLSHTAIWRAIDRLAEANGLSVSGLARLAGLDATAFNRSKRQSPDGKARWPSTESLAKVMAATGTSTSDLLSLLAPDESMPSRRIPVIGYAQAGADGYFDDCGFPVGTGWDEIAFPDVADESAYALEITGDSMAPMYRDGDVIVVSPASPIRRGDRVVVRSQAGEVMAKILRRRSAERIELASLNPDYPDRVFGHDEVAWMARITWASQ